MEGQKEVKEEKYFHYENIGKSAITTIIGVILMAASTGLVLVSQVIELPQMNLWVMVGVFCAGVLLLFAKDKFIDIVVTKFKDKV